MKTIYHFEAQTGRLLGQSEADESPLEPGVYLIPAHATDKPPGTPGEKQFAAFLGGAWSIQAEPVEVAIEPEPVAEKQVAPTVEQLRARIDEIQGQLTALLELMPQ